MRSYRRQLMESHMPLLLDAQKTGQVKRTETSEKALRELLESRALLLYRNDEEWYGVNPAVEPLLKSASAPAS